MNPSPDRSRQYAHWETTDIADLILNALPAPPAPVTIEDLAPYDQFHSGGKEATLHLAELAKLKEFSHIHPNATVLDVGGGLGGPARTLAVEYGCNVTILDITKSYLEVSQVLTQRLALEDKVRHVLGNALALPFEDESFDIIWTQNSGMNISDKDKLYQEFYRVLKPQGMLAFQEPMAGPNQPLQFPVMWASDPSVSFLEPPQQIRSTIEAQGFIVQSWQDVTCHPQLRSRPSPTPAQTVQAFVRKDLLDAITANNTINREENRLVMVQAVATKN